MSNSKDYVKVRTWNFMKPAQMDWLQSMATKHKLSSPSKAVRCCVNCIATDYDNNLPWIGSFENENGVTYILSEQQRTEGPAFELAPQQVDWIDSVRNENAYPDVYLHRALFLWRIVKQCGDMDEYAVFGVIRCKSSVTKCEGAQEALKNVAEQYGRKEGEVEVEEDIDLVSNKR